MALNFPTNPVDGQVFGNFSYDSTFKVWRSTPDVASGLPAGSIMAWGSDTPPASWLICDGSAVSRTTYSSLFNAIGIAHGVGDGSTTFNLPNLKGRMPVGKDSTQTEFDLMGEQGGTKDIQTYGSGTATGYGLVYSSSMASASTPASNMPPYTVLNYIIKTSAGVTAGDSQLVTRFNAVEASVLTKVNLTGGNTVTGTQTLVPTTAAGVALITKGAVSQTADIQQCQNSAGVVLSRVTASGISTVPNQPSFFAGGSGTVVVSGTQHAEFTPFESATVNVGSYYNTSNSRFTAPVAGTYYFWVQYCTTDASSTGPEIALYKNGSQTHIVAIEYNSAFYNTFGASVITTLAANDYVQAAVINNNNTTFTIEKGRSRFGGYLIG